MTWFKFFGWVIFGMMAVSVTATIFTHDEEDAGVSLAAAITQTLIALWVFSATVRG